MVKLIKNVAIQFSSWKTDFRVIMALILGSVLLCLNGYSYLKLAVFLRSEIQAFEMFIICGSTGYSFLASYLGNALLLSNAPFTSEMTAYEVLRLGKRRWIDSRIIYVVSSCFIYSIIILIASVLFSATKCSLNFKNEWSSTISELSIRQPSYILDTFRFAFNQKEYIMTISPYTAVALTVVCNSMYSVLLSMIIMSVNLLTEQSFGWIIASAIHICGYIIYANVGNMFPLKMSLFCHGMPAYYFQKNAGFSILGTISFVLLVFIILREICLYASKKMQL